jgi:hypothetical protein
MYPKTEQILNVLKSRGMSDDGLQHLRYLLGLGPEDATDFISKLEEPWMVEYMSTLLQASTIATLMILKSPEEEPLDLSQANELINSIKSRL